jgi:serine/threonine-protein kinase PRP4
MQRDSGDERDLSDDEEATARKLAESRKRREAMMTKWVTEGTKADDVQIDTPRPADAAPEEGEISDAEPVAPEKPETDASRAQKQEVTKFILSQRSQKEKAEAGDMFDESADAEAKLKTSGAGMAQAIGLTGASGDDWDDEGGYYIAKIGEVMDERYLVVENASGKGVFSNVVKAKDQVNKENGMVAIKVMRANDMMKKAAEKEIEILERLNNADKGNKRHVVRLLSTFYYRKHLCLVFECMWDDLRAALKKYTKGKGMAMQAVRAYSRQLLIGLRHIHKCGIIHADIKPDNILISEGHNVVKFCDLGTALELKDVAISPYLVSRFYRAPEIILGCEYTVAVDVFALGATLYELFTGKILFSSKTNNDALRKIMEVKGKIPKNIIKKGMLWKTHFDDNLDFKFVDDDKYTKEQVTRVMTDLNAKKDLFDMLMERVGPDKAKSTADEDTAQVKRAKQFADLLNQMLALDFEKRVTANDALPHQFVEEKNLRGENRAEKAAAAGAPPAKK